MTGAELVPFGKYKGRAVEELMADTSYCQWLLAQTWFQERYGSLRTIIVNGGQEPQDSPEHNEMQARFLNKDWAMALCGIAGRIWKFDEAEARRGVEEDRRYRKYAEHTTVSITPLKIDRTEFEVNGWDVVVNGAVAAAYVESAGVPCVCVCADHAACAALSVCRGGEQDWGCDHRYHEGYRTEPKTNTGSSSARGHCVKECPWYVDGEWLANKYNRRFSGGWRGEFKILAELKPDLGDDYPAVLRQVKGYKSDGLRCVVVRRFGFEHVTWSQVQEIFMASGIALLREQLIEDEFSAAEDRRALPPAISV